MTDHAQRAITILIAYLCDHGYSRDQVAALFRQYALDGNPQYACNGFLAGVDLAGGNGRKAWRALTRALDSATGAATPIFDTKIEAIKWRRSETGEPLKDAKQWVDEHPEIVRPQS